LLNPHLFVSDGRTQGHGFPPGIAPDGARAPDVPSIAIAMTAPAPGAGCDGPWGRSMSTAGAGEEAGWGGVDEVCGSSRETGEGETPSKPSGFLMLPPVAPRTLSVLKLALARTPRQPHSETLCASRTPVLRTVVPPMVISDVPIGTELEHRRTTFR
jgi:hypothetical protein